MGLSLLAAGLAGLVSACATGPISPPSRSGLGTAALGGQVVDAAQARPLPNVTVTLIDAASGTRRTTTTDAAGRYAFGPLPPGRYLVSAEAPGFVTQVFGQQGWVPEGAPIDLAPGSTLDAVSFRLQRDAVIRGRLVHRDGRPASGVTVEALRPSARGSSLGFVALSRALSGPDGEFRLAGLPPGEYYVAAAPAPADPADPQAAAPTYYPGVSWIGEARRVAVPADGDVGGIDFPLQSVRRVQVSGRMVAPAGERLRTGAVVLNPAVEALGPYGPAATGQLQPDGRFVFAGVLPGRYILVARGETETPGPPLFGTFAVTVEDRDLVNLEIPLRLGTRVTGAVVFEGQAQPPTAAVTRIVVRAPAADGPTSGTDAVGFARPDGSFDVYAMPGRRRLHIDGVPDPWVLKGIYYQGRDVTDRPIPLIEGQPVSGVRIVLTTEAAVLAGRVRAPEGQPVVGYLVIVAPEDPSLWLPRSGRIRLVPVDFEGRFRIRDLPAGAYLLAVADGLDESDLFLSGALPRLAARARRVRLTNGQTTVVELQVASEALTAWWPIPPGWPEPLAALRPPADPRATSSARALR